MTELQTIHHQEQMEAIRADFKILWDILVNAYPWLNNPEDQIIEWKHFLKLKMLAATSQRANG